MVGAVARAEQLAVTRVTRPARVADAAQVGRAHAVRLTADRAGGARRAFSVLEAEVTHARAVGHDARTVSRAATRALDGLVARGPWLGVRVGVGVGVGVGLGLGLGIGLGQGLGLGLG